MLQSIAIPEPFTLELAGDADGVSLLARCHGDEVVEQQLRAHYPQAQIQEVSEEDDPLVLSEGEQAWSMTLGIDGPEFLPLRVFRDDDMLDAGSDPLITLIGSLSNLHEGERVVARLCLRSLGPDWSQVYLEKAHKPAVPAPRDSSYSNQITHHQTDVKTMAILGVVALVGLRGYLWVRAGETWKAVLLGLGIASGLAAAGWVWHRWKKARSRVYDPFLIKEKSSRVAFEADLEVTAVLPPDGREERARKLLDNVAAAYRHYVSLSTAPGPRNRALGEHCGNPGQRLLITGPRGGGPAPRRCARSCTARSRIRQRGRGRGCGVRSSLGFPRHLAEVESVTQPAVRGAVQRRIASVVLGHAALLGFSNPRHSSR